MDNSQIDSLVAGCHADPFSVLGIHQSANKNEWMVRCFLPGAESVDAMERAGSEKLCRLTRIHEAGLFEGKFKHSTRIDYTFSAHYPDGVVVLEDPYRFGSLVSADDLHLFNEGTHENAYDFLGARVLTLEDIQGVLFTVWAPNASRVAVVGAFNCWDLRTHAMRRHVPSGVWELFIPAVPPGTLYKFAIHDSAGKLLPLKADPYAREMELRPGTASRVTLPAQHRWQDHTWMQTRQRRQQHNSAISIYEVHLGSWRHHDDGYLTYRQLGEQLFPYVKALGFTHIQLMPVNEHPFGGSWGYQPIGMFAPTARFGNQDDFRAFVDMAHQQEIGVLLDWVPGHFPTDENGLSFFDGTHLYDYEDTRKGYHPDWNTRIFNYARCEVVSYLLSNALYWLSEFHIDGLRFDAVASMLYLDYSREEGHWLPNEEGGRENLEAERFLKLVNTRAYNRFPDIITVAEESTTWPGVTRRTDEGGLGFGFKWNLGWMNDSLKYMSRDPVHRRYHAQEINFGLFYAFSENFILSLSHDEVVHGKKALLEKMPGDDWQKFANLRAYLGFMWAHPGKKLLFMGAEIAQRIEWSHKRSLDWHLLEYPTHQGIHALVRDLNVMYRKSPALHQADCDSRGFQWIEAGDNTGTIFIFLRKTGDQNASEELLVVSNFTPEYRENFRIGVPNAGTYTELVNTDVEEYGGSGKTNPIARETSATECHGHPWSLTLTLPPLATMYLAWKPKSH